MRVRATPLRKKEARSAKEKRKRYNEGKPSAGFFIGLFAQVIILLFAVTSLLSTCHSQSLVEINQNLLQENKNDEDATTANIVPENIGDDIQGAVLNFANETRNKFYEALFNLSHYLPLSVDYAVSVGHNCNIIEYNKSYYGPPGLIIAAALFIIGVLFCFVG